MADAMQMPQPLDEHSGQLADSLLESPETACECESDGAAPAAAEGGAEALQFENMEANASGEAVPPEAEFSASEQASTDESSSGEAASGGEQAPEPLEEAAADSSSESISVVEIDWELEVEAFVKAEAEAAATIESAAATEEGASAEESAEVVAGMDAAGKLFAGTIGAAEAELAEESASATPGEAAGDAGDGAGPEAASGSLPELSEETPVEIGAASEAAAPGEAAADPSEAKPQEDRRKRRRAMISAPVRVRGVNVTNGGPVDISTTIDVSRGGILFVATASGYYKGMEVAVIFPYSEAPTAIHTEQRGRVVRIVELPGGRTAVALALGIGIGEDLVDAAGRKLTGGAAADAAGQQQTSDKPLVLAMDPDPAVRVSLKTLLEMEGYQVIAVGTVADSRAVLDMCVPALVIAEIEGDGLSGEGMPGYDLCAYIKETRRLKRIPVVLTTQSGYPSDYSNAHSLGAIVCMAKPYKQERLGHVVRLLAPLQAHKEAPAVASCKADPKRKACATPHHGAGHAPVVKNKYDENTNPRRKYRFPSFR